MFDLSSQNVTNVSTMGFILGLPLLAAFGCHCVLSRYCRNNFLLGIVDVLIAFFVLGLVVCLKKKI